MPLPYLSAPRIPPGQNSKIIKAGVITIEFAIKKMPIHGLNLRSFYKIGISIISLCQGAPGTRQEALGTLGIESTSIEKENLVSCFSIFLIVPS